MGEQEITATLFTSLVRRKRAVLAGMAVCVGGLVALAWDWPFGLVLVAAYLVLCAMFWFRDGLSPWWPPAARRLLATQPWRERPVTVLKVDGTVLVLPGDEHVRVYGLPAEAREVVVRARRVWLVGPDAAGWLAVRVDGLYTPWPARRVPPHRGEPAEPNGPAIATIWLKNQVTKLRTTVAASVVSVLAFATMMLLESGWWVFLSQAVCLLSTLIVTWRIRRLTRRSHAEESWVRAEAVDPVWRVRAFGQASGTVTLAYPDGRRFTAHLDRVPLDLFANAAREKALWAADNGVVGFPYYPILARASLTPVTVTVVRPPTTRSPVG